MIKFQDQIYTDYAPRLAAWRLGCVTRKRELRFGQNATVLRARSLQASEDLPIQLRRGRCTRDVLAAMEFALDDADWAGHETGTSRPMPASSSRTSSMARW